MYKRIFIISVLASFFMASCGTKQSEADVNTESNENVTLVTPGQFEQMNMQLGNALKHTFYESLSVQGVVEPRVNGIAVVSSPIHLIVKKVHVYDGARVAKGDALVSLIGSELMDLQMNYVEARQEFILNRANFDRMKQLLPSNAVSQKEFMQSESDFRIAQARLAKYANIISWLGIDTLGITKGNLVEYVTLKSPIDGNVVGVNAIVGMAVNPEQELVKVVNPALMQLKLFVYANEVKNVSAGQPVQVSIEGTALRGTITGVGMDANNDTKAVICHASLKDASKYNLINGQNVTASILIREVKGWALPNTAIYEKDGHKEILVGRQLKSGDYEFRVKPVITGISDAEYIQIMDSTVSNVLYKGVYELMME